MVEIKEAVLERLKEIIDSINYGMETRIVIEWSPTDIPTINYDIKEAIVERGVGDDN